MPRPTPLHLRQAIRQQAQQGHTVAQAVGVYAVLLAVQSSSVAGVESLGVQPEGDGGGHGRRQNLVSVIAATLPVGIGGKT